MVSKLESHPLYETIKGEIEKLILSVKNKIADGINLMEIVGLVNEFVTATINITQAINASPEERRELCILIASACWDDIAPKWDIPYLPDRIIDPIIAKLIPIVVGELYDWLLDRDDLPSIVTVSPPEGRALI
jgi:hypothetical protein